MMIYAFLGIIILRMMFLENIELIKEEETIMGVIFHIVLAFAYLFATLFLAWMCDPSSGIINMDR